MSQKDLGATVDDSVPSVSQLEVTVLTGRCSYKASTLSTLSISLSFPKKNNKNAVDEAPSPAIYRVYRPGSSQSHGYSANSSIQNHLPGSSPILDKKVSSTSLACGVGVSPGDLLQACRSSVLSADRTYSNRQGEPVRVRCPARLSSSAIARSGNPAPRQSCIRVRICCSGR